MRSRIAQIRHLSRFAAEQQRRRERGSSADRGPSRTRSCSRRRCPGCAETIAAAICAPIAAPEVRMIVFIPLVTPVSSGREWSITSAPIAASANAMPTPMIGSQSANTSWLCVQRGQAGEARPRRGRGRSAAAARGPAWCRARPRAGPAAIIARLNGSRIRPALGRAQAEAEAVGDWRKPGHEHEERGHREADQHRARVRRRHRRGAASVCEVDERVLRPGARSRPSRSARRRERGEREHAGGGPAPFGALAEREQQRGEARPTAPRRPCSPASPGVLIGDSGTNFAISAVETSTGIAPIRNSHCQLRCSTITPLSTRPTPPPIPNTELTVPIATPTFCGAGTRRG